MKNMNNFIVEKEVEMIIIQLELFVELRAKGCTRTWICEPTAYRIDSGELLGKMHHEGNQQLLSVH